MTRFFFYLLLATLLPLTFSQTVTQNTSSFQTFEFYCANDVSLTHVVAAPGQITLIYDGAFYPMQQVSKTTNSSVGLRYEDKNFLWIAEDGVGRLEQKDGKILAENCVPKPPKLAYVCMEDVTLEVQYAGDVAHINVFDPLYGDQSYELPKVTVVSGAKFSNGMTTWFLSGEEGNLFEETEEVQHAQKCKLQQE